MGFITAIVSATLFTIIIVPIAFFAIVFVVNIIVYAIILLLSLVIAIVNSIYEWLYERSWMFRELFPRK